MFGRNKVAMLVAEFLGTGVLTLVVLSVQRSTIGIAYFVALAAGLAVASLSYVFSDVSGAHFNPAVTIGSLITGRVKVVAAAAYVVAQLLGAWAAYGVYTYFVNSSLQQIGGHYTARVLIAEAVGAFIFTFVWAAVAAKKLAPSLVGVGLTLGIIVSSVASIGFINPAVAMGARAWNIWGSMGWGTYAAGPILGGILGFGLYELVFSKNGFNFSMKRAVSVPKATVSKPVSKSPAKKKAPAKKRK